MATGDQNDFVSRLQQLLPHGWFANGVVPIRDALVQGLAYTHAFVYSLFAYVRLQSRIATATDGFLDMIVGDFLGNSLPRGKAQSDASYRARVLAAIFLERATRPALIRMLTQVTGRAPIVIEPMRGADVGGYSAYGGYGVAGVYGSMSLPFQFFVKAFRPVSDGGGGVTPYGLVSNAITGTGYALWGSFIPQQLGTAGHGGYGVGAIEYTSLSMFSAPNDADIYSAIDSIRPVGYTAWVQISN